MKRDPTVIRGTFNQPRTSNILPDDLLICCYPKHDGRAWTEVLDEDPEYVHWIISSEGPYTRLELLDYLASLIEGDEDE